MVKAITFKGYSVVKTKKVKGKKFRDGLEQLMKDLKASPIGIIKSTAYDHWKAYRLFNTGKYFRNFWVSLDSEKNSKDKMGIQEGPKWVFKSPKFLEYPISNARELLIVFPKETNLDGIDGANEYTKGWMKYPLCAAKSDIYGIDYDDYEYKYDESDIDNHYNDRYVADNYKKYYLNDDNTLILLISSFIVEIVLICCISLVIGYCIVIIAYAKLYFDRNKENTDETDHV